MQAAHASLLKRVFVTSLNYNGAMGGLSGMDTECQNRADLAGLGGTWVAWASNSTVNARNHIAESSVGYYLIDETTKIADNKSDLIDGSLLNAISQDENGNPLAKGVWTGTMANGTVNTNTCSDWTLGNLGTKGAFGFSNRTNGTWTVNNGFNCSNSFGIYCFEN